MSFIRGMVNATCEVELLVLDGEVGQQVIDYGKMH